MSPTALRRAVAATMTASAAVPQFTLEMRADVSHALALSEVAALSVEDIVIASVGRTLPRHPRLNSSYIDKTGAINEHDEVNVGVAIAVEDGIVAPAVCGADRMLPTEIRAERRRLINAARTGALRPAELYSATFTVSNLGGHRIPRFRALVIPPQAAILAVGALNKRNRLWLSLSVDHRVTDGVPAARFLTDLVDDIEGNHP